MLDLLHERAFAETVFIEETLLEEDRGSGAYSKVDRVARTGVDLVAVDRDVRVERVVADAGDRDPLDGSG